MDSFMYFFIQSQGVFFHAHFMLQSYNEVNNKKCKKCMIKRKKNDVFQQNIL